MARFAFAFANTTILTPARLSVVQVGMTVLENGSVLIQSLSQPWTLTAERLESGEIAVTGGNGLSLFRYSIDGGISWLEDVSPSTIFHQGEVLFESIGTTESAGGINGASIGVEPDGDLVIYKLPSVWELTATRTVGHDIEISGGRAGSKFRYSLDAGASWFESFLPAIVTSEGAAIFEPLGDEIRFGGIKTDEPLDADYVVGEFDAAHSILQTGPATALNKFGFVGSPEVRTNLCLYSQEFDNAGWGKAPTPPPTITPNTIVAPNGTLTADTWARSSNGSAYITRSIGKGATVDTYTMSVFVKKGSAQYFSLRIQGNYPNRADVTFDLNNGTVSHGPDVVVFTAPSASIVSVGGGWFRCSLTATTDATAALSALISFSSVNAQIDGSGGLSVCDGHIWGAQVELGNKTTAYIPTTTAAVTSTLPRFEYDMGEPVVGVSRTNLTPWSQALDNVAWSKTNTSMTSGATLLGLPAFTVSSTANLNSFIRSASPQPLQFSTTYTRTIFTKAVSGSGNIYFEFSIGGVQGSAWFNLLTGVASINPGLGVASMQDMGDGVWRCRHTFTTTNTGTPHHRGVYIGVYGNSPAVTTVILTGDQLEVGSEPTDYIPTYASAVTTNLTYNPVVRGLLVEPARTNLYPYSEDFGNAAWIKSNATLTPNTALAPDGKMTADTVVFGNFQSAEIRQPFSPTSATTYTVSVWAKVAAGTKAFRLKIWDGSSDKFSSELIADTEWRRFSFTVTTEAIAGIPNVAIRNAALGGAGDLIVWGGQLEVGVEASSYIPTTTSTVTRPADVLTLNYTDKPDGVYTARLWHSDYDYTEVDNLTVLGGQVNITGVTTKPVLAIKLIFKSYLLRTQIPDVLPSQYNVIQPSVATRVSVAGVVGSPGTRTNLARLSQTPANSAWTPVANVSKVSTTEADPFGTNTALLLRSSGGASLAALSVSDAAYVSGETYTISAFVKAGTHSLVQLTGPSAAFGAAQYANFDLASGSKGTVVGGAAEISPVGAGWFRISFTTVATVSTSSGAGVICFINGQADPRVPIFTAVADCYVSGWQLERGDKASNYIPTTTAPVTNTLPRFDYDAGILRGLLVEPARINRCTNFNANPTDLTGVSKAGDAAATLTVVDDTAALTAAGLIGLCATGKVYKLDNSGGTTDAILQFSGGTGGVFESTSSAYLRGSGSGIVRMYTVGAASLPLAAEYQRLSLTGTPSADQAMVVAISAGSVVYCILNQLETGAGASSVIPISGAAVTRPADTLKLTGLAKGNGTYTARCWHADNSYIDVLNVVVSNGATSIVGISTKPVISVEFR